MKVIEISDLRKECKQMKCISNNWFNGLKESIKTWNIFHRFASKVEISLKSKLFYYYFIIQSIASLFDN